MEQQDAHLKQSALLMRILGWAFLAAMIPAVLIFPNGFLWGGVPITFPGFCFTHGPSHLDGLHPYLFMLAIVYVAWCILLIRGARDPKANVALFDFGILANLLHGLAMIPMAFIYPNETDHLFMDIPLLFVICAVLWYWHPNRVTGSAA